MSSRSHHQQQLPKLKPPLRPIFTCGMFRHCTRTVLSPTTTPSAPSIFPPSTTTNASATSSPPPPTPPPSSPPLPPPLPPPHPQPQPTVSTTRDTTRATTSSSSSSSSSSSASQSFTQWRLFPIHHQHTQNNDQQNHASIHRETTTDLAGAFNEAEEKFKTGEKLSALRLLEKSLSSDYSAGGGIPCDPAIMCHVVTALRETFTARHAAKVLLALLLAEKNRKAAVESGAISAAIEAVAIAGVGGAATAERALAALELLCTVEEGANETRRNELAASVMAGAAEGMGGRGRECAIGVLAAVYGGDSAEEAPAEVGRAVAAALGGECTARCRRKGMQLLKALQRSSSGDGGGD